MEIPFTLLEIENLLMMHGHCERHFKHSHAVSAVAKLQKARKQMLLGGAKPVEKPAKPEDIQPIPLDFE
jgi:hypothetical protein